MGLFGMMAAGQQANDQQMHELDDPTLPGPARSPNSLRVLVVEDRDDVAMGLAVLLVRLGHEVRMAADGDEALAVAAAFPPAVVFLDIGLPRRDGYEVCMEMRRTTWGAAAFIVAVTGRGEPKDLIRSATTGFDRHVVKPMDMGTLREILAIAHDRAA